MENSLPSHIAMLIRDLTALKNTEQVLLYYTEFFLSDPYLHLLYIELGYNPNKGEFDKIPQVEVTIKRLCEEYAGLKIPLKRTWSDGSESCSEKARNNKGLKVLSARVKSILIAKKLSSYRQVAEELIKELNVLNKAEEKNILRRVYDALNVLIAAGVVVKQGKDYCWKTKQNISSTSKLTKHKDLVFKDLQMQHPENIKKFPIMFVTSNEIQDKIVLETNKNRSLVRLKFTKNVRILNEQFLVIEN